MDRSGTYAAGLPALSRQADRQTRLGRGHRNRLTLLILALIAGLTLLLAALVPLLPLPDPVTATNYNAVLQAPGASHILGTDLHGRDELSRLLWASRTSLTIGITVTALALAIGVLMGGLAGYRGGIVDSVLMRLADIFLSFPIVLGAIAIMAIFGPGRRNVFIAITFFGWPVFARVFRASVISIKEKTFVKAAWGLGASGRRVFLRHVLPNAVTPLATYASLMVAGAIMAEAGLSYINLGVQRPEPSWGLMLADSSGNIGQAPWLVIAPGAAITLTALLFILMGAAVTRILAQPGSWHASA